MSRRLASFISAVMLFGVMGGIGLPSSAAEEVQAVRGLFSTSQEINSICIQENNASVTIRPGEDDQTRVSYADTSEEKLYDIYVKDGALVVEKLKENPRHPIIVGETTPFRQTVRTSTVSSEDKYLLEITVPQKQYDSITITNASNGYAKLDSISSKTISVQLTTGYAELSQTKSNRFDAEIDKGYITLDDTDSLEYDFKVEIGKITGSVLGSSSDYTIEQSIEDGVSNLTSRTGSVDGKVIKLALDTGIVDIDFAG